MLPHVTCVTLYPQDLFLGIIRILVLSCYFQEKQRSFTSGDFWVLPRWQVTHFQFLSVFQDGGHVKFPTLGQRLNVKIPTQGKARSVNFPWLARPPTLGLNIDRCITSHTPASIFSSLLVPCPILCLPSSPGGWIMDCVVPENIHLPHALGQWKF